MWFRELHVLFACLGLAGIASTVNGVPTECVPTVEFIGKTPDTLLNIAGLASSTEEASIGNNETILFDPFVGSDIAPALGADDAALDEGEGASGMPDPIKNFKGISSLNTGAPPDTVGDIGPHHYVQMVNRAIAVFDKEGNTIINRMPINDLFEIDSDCGDGGGDPIVLYDQFEDRWLLTQFTARCRRSSSSTRCYDCMAVSETGDPTGSYNLYKISAQDDPDGVWPSVFADYPKYSVWSDSFILTTRDFGGAPPAVKYNGVSVYAIEKAPMIVGSAIVQCKQFILDKAVEGPLIGDGLHMLGADIDGSKPPPHGSPIPILSSQDDDWVLDSGAQFDAVNVWELIVDWTDFSSASFAFKESLPVPEFSSNVGGNNNARDDVAQPMTSQKVASLARFMLYRLAYRNFGEYESMVAVRGGTERKGRSSALGVRWFEIRREISCEGDTMYYMHQASTFSPDDDVNRWMASIAQDRKGNIAMGYSVSNGDNVYPGIRYAGRLVDDELNKMTLGENTLIDGSAFQSDGSPRWGDYSSMNIDPVDDCTFWYTNEYYEAIKGEVNQERNWQTRIGSFVLPGCKSKGSKSKGSKSDKCKSTKSKSTKSDKSKVGTKGSRVLKMD